MSQDSILELLSVTSNAVKALDKTSSSKSSGSGRGTPREEDVVAPPLCSRVDQTSRRSSGDSGVGKTASRSVTVKDKAKTDDGEDSDHSTTASDVLIRSTLAGPEDKMISLNSSAASHSSRRSDLDNFNIADAKKVKVSKKQLREIVSPRDSCDFKQPKDMSAEANLNRNFNNHGVADLNSNNSNNKQLRRGDTDDRIGKENRGKMINGLTGKVINSGVEKHSTGKGSSYPLANSKHAKDLPSKTTGSSTAAYTVERHPDYQKRAPTQDFPPEWSQRDGQTVADLKPSGGPASYESKHVEGSKPSSHQALYESKHAQDSKQTVTRTSVEMEDQPEDWEEGEAESVTSSQPEIVTIPERVVNISSQALLPSEDDDSVSLSSAVDKVSQANKAQSFPRAQPFLKLQQELEAKMQTLLAEMDRIQKGASTGATAESQNVTNTGTRRMEYLEQQVQELTERRLQHLETLQNQQMEMQAHLLSMSRGMSQQQARYPSNMPSTTYPTAINLGTSRQQPYSRPFIEHQLAQGRMFGEQGGVEKQAGGCQHDDGGPKGSLLDTPAPREKPPRPVEYGGSKGSGLLHEILAAEPSPQLNTTFSLPPGHTPPVKLGRSSSMCWPKATSAWGSVVSAALRPSQSAQWLVKTQSCYARHRHRSPSAADQQACDRVTSLPIAFIDAGTGPSACAFAVFPVIGALVTQAHVGRTWKLTRFNQRLADTGREARTAATQASRRLSGKGPSARAASPHRAVFPRVCTHFLSADLVSTPANTVYTSTSPFRLPTLQPHLSSTDTPPPP
ncbi:hypothetical protein BaRGS_00020395 [Batillaria attramentaria]|uniref:Uncharacterized protein n=1 Tax=Batillaria attramentaria TaxID=370345 RepID=A0ABD0KND0_9CAEN